ncbi:MAG TPA: hypothetical protein VL598_11930 [Trinickia sp.]|nr:hypothetical protein [Trinickia sp.]HTI18365.1 hypothetical protein [Trinickia sp.]
MSDHSLLSLVWYWRNGDANRPPQPIPTGKHAEEPLINAPIFQLQLKPSAGYSGIPEDVRGLLAEYHRAGSL